IGEDINKKIIAKIAEANTNLLGIIDKVDFDDSSKLGTGKDLVDTLTGLISVFQKDELDFSKNNAEGDDILGDAYEYLMSKFATESVKSKGQFYTPAEVSRVIAKVIGADKITQADVTLYDPTCGSGSLLLKVAYEAQSEVSIYGQEKDITTVGLALMNMYLHNCPMAEIKQGNTIAKPQFLKNNDTALETFDYVVANPPFSTKAWSSGIQPNEDIYGRFELGIPPEKNGDYAFLLHILKSMKQTGHGAVILPHGVLFRGNAEETIRKNIVNKRWIKGIISLPANLFYGTGIPACIIVLDKSAAETRKGIFMIDASRGFIKDGNKNRLRECDIKKIVDTFNAQQEIPKYSRLVPMNEIIEKNDYNLNIPRYIDSQDSEDIQDIKAHLLGGIPNFNIEELSDYWQTFASVRTDLFEDFSDDYSRLKPEIDSIKEVISASVDFIAYTQEYNNLYQTWANQSTPTLKNIVLGTQPKVFIEQLGNSILSQYSQAKLINKYDVYQALMEYWYDTMQDDVYIISEIGYQIELQELRTKKGKKEIVTYYCDLVPQPIVANRYFSQEVKFIADTENLLNEVENLKEQIVEEHCVEDGLLDNDAYAKGGKLKQNDVVKYIKANKNNADCKEEIDILSQWLNHTKMQGEYLTTLIEKDKELYEKVLQKYAELSEDEIKTLVVEDKWLAHLSGTIEQLLSDLTQKLSQRIKQIALRYEKTLPELEAEQEELKNKVKQHLATMGY
ncbi:MAG: type I restriction-modification system subunit M, partial [Neisseriaceae bacterium]|nr:type I restriction-modification system subunit M [Neisseriaceae bacterium]